MAVTTEETGGGATVIDHTYEFSAPRFFDFVRGESDEESLKAELWFDTALSYAPSRMFFFSLFLSHSTLITRLDCVLSDHYHHHHHHHHNNKVSRVRN